MCDKAFEKSIVKNSASTLAGLKVANLYNFSFSSYDDCKSAIDEANRELNVKGVYVELLQQHDDFYLIYVYRPVYLAKALTDKNINAFLAGYGYGGSTDVARCLGVLKTRLNGSDSFPHEIGVFLGYPLDDIKGFIDNKGMNYIYCGIWKVYRNEIEAQKSFMKFDKCTSIYMDVYNRGRSIFDLTVSA